MNFPAFNLKNITRPVHIAPLAVFRVLFGGVMLAGTVRFFLKGWIKELYIDPQFYFFYWGLDWIRPLSGSGMYIVFGLMAISALFILLGLFYRLAASLFFIAFTYVELIDKTNYLNHYYFISIISFLMMLVPAHRYFSLDVLRKPALKVTHVPLWMIGIFKLQLGMVYFYAGVAKLNYDWLFRAMPLKIWLPANAHLPVIGRLLDEVWVAYLFSWFGALYDLSIPFLLAVKRTRAAAFLMVVAFHLLTLWLFPIGMFPYIMILSTLIFFSEEWHKNVINFFLKSEIRNPKFEIFKNRSFPLSRESLSSLRFRARPEMTIKRENPKFEIRNSKFEIRNSILLSVITIHFIVQLLLPWRFLLYPGNLFWTEQGYRFSWRVMLMEKAGTAFFYVKDAATGRESEVINSDYLTKNQEKMMATQPDMILQYAHFLRNEFSKKGLQDPKVRVESYVTLNGSGSRLFIDPAVNLAEETEKFSHKSWILPFTTDDIPAKRLYHEYSANSMLSFPFRFKERGEHAGKKEIPHQVRNDRFYLYLDH